MKAIDSCNQDNYPVGTILVFYDGDIGVVKKTLDGLCHHDHPVRKVLLLGEKEQRTVCCCCAIPIGNDPAILSRLTKGGEA